MLRTRPDSALRPNDPESSVLGPQLFRILGDDTAPITAVEARARASYPGTPFIVWEGDAATFAFTYVGGDAEKMLGFPAKQWVADPAFWSTQVIHPKDRAEAVAFCALATGQKADHVFEYRALTQQQDVRWLRDYVRVVIGPRGLPVRLRGLMFDVSEEKGAEQATRQAAAPPVAPLRLPSVAALEAAG